MKPKNKTNMQINPLPQVMFLPAKRYPTTYFVLVFQAKTHILLTLLKYISKLSIFQCRAYLHEVQEL